MTRRGLNEIFTLSRPRQPDGVTISYEAFKAIADRQSTSVAKVIGYECVRWSIG